MARAYKKTYLNSAMRNLGAMMDCGVRKYGYPIEEFYQKFLSCDVSRQFASGNPRYLVGLSGAELADLVVEASGGIALSDNDGTFSPSPEYWAGWVLAYYQWLKPRSFSYMYRRGLGIQEVIALYCPLHEADLSKFADAADAIIGRSLCTHIPHSPTTSSSASSPAH
jgi:hypothetical protein